MYGYKLGLKKVGESVPAAPVNVVQPLLTGNGAVGTVVTCSNGSWTGSPSPTFSFNFKANGVSVQNGASNTYTPLIGDDTKTLTCLVTATNTQGSASEGASNSLVVGTIPNNTVAPVISGTNTFGSTLTTTDGTFTGTAPITYTYQWLRNGSPISGQTASTYVIGASDSLANITCSVTATNSYGSDSEVSNTITVVDFAPVNTVAPTVSPSGTQSTGTLITSNVGTWSGVTPITYEYKWTRNGVAISGATASTYTIQSADDGTTIRVEVKGSNTYGESAFVASSNSVSAVNAIAPSNTVAPVISGTAVVGQTLTSTTGTWTGTPTPTYSYQWKRGATNVGTNSSTYTLVQADAGNASNITCVVTGTNSAGSANATSNTIAQILTARTSAFLTASAISDATIRGGLNTFDIGLIANSLDTKMRAVYPFVADGVDNNARALQQRWNFMDARDLNAAFRLSFSGTLVHSSTGINTNGTNGFYDTNFNCASNGSLNNQSAGVYIRTDLNGIGSSLDFGTEFTSGALLQIYTKVESGGVQYYLGRVNDNNVQLVTNTNSQGFYSISRSSNTTYLRQKNNSVSTITESSISLPTGNILGFKNLTTYTARQQAFAFIGDGLTNTEMTNYYTLIQALQTTLGRQV